MHSRCVLHVGLSCAEMYHKAVADAIAWNDVGDEWLSYLGIGLSVPGALGGDSNESRSTRLYLPARTWRAPSLSSKAAPTLDLNGSNMVWWPSIECHTYGF